MAGRSKVPAVFRVARAGIVGAPSNFHCLITCQCEEECVAAKRVSIGTAEAVQVGEYEVVTSASVLLIKRIFMENAIGATGVQTESTTKVVRASLVLSSSADRERNAIFVGYFISVTTDTSFLPGGGLAWRRDFGYYWIHPRRKATTTHVLVDIVFERKLLTKTEPLVDVLTAAKGVPNLGFATWRLLLPCQIRSGL